MDVIFKISGGSDVDIESEKSPKIEAATIAARITVTATKRISEMTGLTPSSKCLSPAVNRCRSQDAIACPRESLTGQGVPVAYLVVPSFIPRDCV